MPLESIFKGKGSRVSTTPIPFNPDAFTVEFEGMSLDVSPELVLGGMF